MSFYSVLAYNKGNKISRGVVGVVEEHIMQESGPLQQEEEAQ